MEMSLRAITKDAEKKLWWWQRKQIPYATSLALTDTAFEVREREQELMPKKIDRPKPFTVKGVFVKKATKTNLVAIVRIPENRAKYMFFQIDGGFRMPGGRVLAVPTDNVPRDKYGNVPKRWRPANVLRTMDAFSGIPNGRSGPEGIWLRGNRSRSGTGKKGGANSSGKFRRSSKRGTSLALLYVYKSRITYRGNVFPFFAIAESVATRRFEDNFEKRLAEALESAK